LVAAVGLFLSLGGTASAAVGCTFDSTTLTVSVVINDAVAPFNNTVTLKRSGQTITVNGAPCFDGFGVTATVVNTDQINVTPAPAGADGNDTLVVDLSAGPFSPGFSAEAGPGSLNEIEIFADLGLGANTVQVIGSNAAEGVTGGQDGTLVDNWDGLPVLAANGLAFTVPEYGDLLLNLNSGLLTDDDADLWVVNGNSACATITPVPRNQQGILDPLGCFVWALDLQLDGGDNVVFLKGGDGTGFAICDLGFNIFSDGFDNNPFPVTISTGTGNDTIIGSECSDIIQPGGGNDFVDGNGPDFGEACAFQDDVLGEWSFIDFHFGNFPFEVFDCFSSGDLVDLSGLDGPATIVLNPDGSLTITGITGTFVGVEHVIGTKGDDTITGNQFSNFLGGGPGNDTIFGDDPACKPPVGTDPSDPDCFGSDVLDGGEGNDTLAGLNGNDVQIGGPGDDVFNENLPMTAEGVLQYGPLGNGADPMDGGPGIDTVTYDKRTNSTVVYLGLISTFNDGADTNGDGLTNEFDDVFNTTENVLTGSGNDIISANFTNNRANNVFVDNAGNDCVEGGPGNDQFQQGAAPQGADVQIGNTGSDWSNYGADSSPVVGPAAQTTGRTDAIQGSLDGVNNDGDIATNEGDAIGGFSVSCRPATIIVAPPITVTDFFFQFIDHVLSFTDTPIPGPAPNCFFDPIINGPGKAQQGFPSTCVGEPVGGDNSPLTNVDVENVNGGAGNDILVGSDVGNVLNGQGGNDQISGNASTDQLNGGDGDDTINPGSGNDAVDGGTGTNTVDYASAGAGGVGVQVNLATGKASGDGNDTLALATIQNVNGSSFADSITGDEQANALWGRGGSDAIQGKAGDDTIFGGAGADQIASGSGADNVAGQDGNDAVQGGAQDDRLQGGNGRDTILGQKGNDRLFGNAQPDFLNGGPGSDTCRPGSPGLARGDVVVNCEA
jgi:Ca2+-binding RTX toxin-like protein